MRTTLGFTLALLLTACSDGSDAVSPRQSSGDAPAYTAVAAGQTEGILDLIARQEATWAAKDALAYAATYTVDAELINPVAGILSGRAMIAAQHAFLFNPVSGFFRASTSTIALRSITFLTGTIALVQLDVTLTGISVLPPGLPATEPGVVRTRVTWIAVKQGKEWLIMHQQMTPFPATP